MSSFLYLRQILEDRLEPAARKWFKTASAEMADDVSGRRFGALLSTASRHARRRPLELDEGDLAQAAKVLPGWNPERWNLLEALRVALILSRGDLKTEQAAVDIEEAFQYADEGELCALYRSLAHLPDAARFAWRAGEGCRSNMVTVFEAVALDTPYPREHFDDATFRQAAIKALFVEAPLWRLVGLDERGDAELARMALDLAEERRSAGREVQPELWLCLGTHGGDRGLSSLVEEFAPENPSTRGRAAAALGLARAGQADLLRQRLEGEADPVVRETLATALEGHTDPSAFRPFSAEVSAAGTES